MDTIADRASQEMTVRNVFRLVAHLDPDSVTLIFDRVKDKMEAVVRVIDMLASIDLSDSDVVEEANRRHKEDQGKCLDSMLDDTPDSPAHFGQG